MKNKVILEELEFLTGKMLRGDITPLMYQLIKDSPFLDDFIDEYGVYLTEDNREYVSKQRNDKDTSENSSRGFDFEEWLGNSGKPISF